jgi:hypothetical protein
MMFLPCLRRVFMSSTWNQRTGWAGTDEGEAYYECLNKMVEIGKTAQALCEQLEAAVECLLEFDFNYRSMVAALGNGGDPPRPKCEDLNAIIPG